MNGYEIKNLNEKQISMYRLSKMTGIPETTINNIRHKRIKSVSFHTAYIIARTLEIDLDDLVPDEWKKSK